MIPPESSPLSNFRGARKTLELVLKLLLDLAGHKQNFWALVEAQIKGHLEK
jgi:hypothetical protein